MDSYSSSPTSKQLLIGQNHKGSLIKNHQSPLGDFPATFVYIVCLHTQGPVVRKLVYANLGLEFDEGPCFSYFKRVFTAKFQMIQFERNQSQKCKTGICIAWLAGLA